MKDLKGGWERMTRSAGGVFGKNAWRKRLTLLALLALALQPILPIALANASDISNKTDANSSLQADLLYTCLTGQASSSKELPFDSQNDLNLRSCPWCLSGSFAKVFAIAPSFNGLVTPIANSTLGYIVSAQQTSAAAYSTDINPRAPPSMAI